MELEGIEEELYRAKREYARYERQNTEDLYLNTAGEIEARESGKRWKLSKEERRKEQPYIGDENTVFAYDRKQLGEPIIMALEEFKDELNKAFDESSETVKNALPNVEKATINPNKLTGYALNPDHPVGGNKAKVFESALGYNQSNSDNLIKQIYEKLPQNEAILGKLDQFGQRYTVDIPITGPNGNTVNVRTGWIIKTGSDVLELTTIFVK